MARFIGYVQGNRGEASRLGTPDSGIAASAQGWKSGITVLASVDKDGRDVFQVIQTGGSNGSSNGKELLRVVTYAGENGLALVDCGSFTLSLDRLIEIAKEHYSPNPEPPETWNETEHLKNPEGIV